MKSNVAFISGVVVWASSIIDALLHNDMISVRALERHFYWMVR